MEGKFITIEGTDGAGKTTQIQLLVSYLNSKGYDVIVTREPGGTSISEKIRNIILDVENREMNYITETLLYAASRAQHVNEKIIPAIKEGKIVICDRFLDSSLAYQGYARGISLELIKEVNKVAINSMTPHLTLFFDLDPQIGIMRKKNMHELDRMETEKLDFHMKVYNGYKALCKTYPQRMKEIDASKTIEEIHQQVIKIVEDLIG